MLLPRSSFTTVLIAVQFLLGQPNGVAGDTSQYPAAQPCFDSATAAAKCDNSSTAVFNACACSNTGDWLGLSAKCIGATDSSELTAIYNSLASNCAGSNTPIVYSLNQWLTAAAASGSTAARTTTVSAAGTTKISTVVQTSAVVSTVTLAPTGGQSTPVVSVLSYMPGQATGSVVTLIQSGSTGVVTLGVAQATASGSTTVSGSQGKGGSKLNTQSIIGIAVGVPCFLALMALLLFLLMRKRKQENRYSAPSEMAYDPHDSTHYGGAVVAAKTRPPSTGTVLSDAASQPSYQHNPYPAAQPLDPYQQQEYSSQQPQSMMRPVSYLHNPQFPATGPDSGAIELQGQPVARAHELPGYR